MSFLIKRITKRIYGEEFRLDLVTEDPKSKRQCFEIYDSKDNYIGSAYTIDEVYDVIRENTR